MNTTTHPSATATPLSLILSALAGTVATILAALTGHPAATGTAIVGACLTGYLAAAHRYRQRLGQTVAQARRDPLTGLPNRALADEMLDEATHAGTPLSVALIDVNGLHTINTNLGHAAGDQYLTTVAGRLTRAVPPGGVLVRHGGDEFALLAPGSGPQQLADRIGAALAGRAVIAGYRVQPRASVGIATTGTDSDRRADARHARARADSALYTAKRDGGNRIRLFDPGRDPEPAADGTRPLLRRRDINPLAEAGMAWLPSPGDELIPVLMTPDDLRAVVQALSTAAETSAQTATDAAAGRLATPGSSTPGRMTIEPDPAGNAGIAGLAREQQTRHTRLLQRLRPIMEVADSVDDAGQAAATPPAPAPAVVVLTGVSAAFTAADLEALIAAAAQAVHGHRDDLNTRQRVLAARAWDLLHGADGD